MLSGSQTLAHAPPVLPPCAQGRVADESRRTHLLSWGRGKDSQLGLEPPRDCNYPQVPTVHLDTGLALELGMSGRKSHDTQPL